MIYDQVTRLMKAVRQGDDPGPHVEGRGPGGRAPGGGGRCSVPTHVPDPGGCGSPGMLRGNVGPLSRTDDRSSTIHRPYYYFG